MARVQPGIDVVGLLELIPTLLDACVIFTDNDLKKPYTSTRKLLSLRLINKEASRVALLALRKYRLFLTAGEKNSNLLGTRLLRKTQLKKLYVYLKTSESYNPTGLLDFFLSKMGTALSTVTSLSVSLQMFENADVDINDTALGDQLRRLIGSCPLLERFKYQGQLSSSLLRFLAETCPRLSALSIRDLQEDVPDMQSVVDLLPSLFPSLKSLSFPMFSQADIPDLSKNTSIARLKLDKYAVEGHSVWLCLPPKLQHLECYALGEGLPASRNGVSVLASLLSVNLEICETDMETIVQLLQAAPCLKGPMFTSAFKHEPDVLMMEFPLCQSTVGNLLFLRERMDSSWLNSVEFSMERDIEEDIVLAVSALPCMPGFTRCEFQKFEATELRSLLSMFPDVQYLSLSDLNDLDDVALQLLGACVHLKELSLIHLDEISVTGVLALCMRLPALRKIRHSECSQFVGTEQGLCRLNALMQGLPVVIEDYFIHDQGN